MLAFGQYSPDDIAPLLLVVVVALAVRYDLLEQRIPNALIIGALAVGLVTQSALGGFNGFLQALAGAGVGLACLLPLYFGKGIGAGDVKLMGAVGLFLGPANAFLAIMLTLITGGVLAIAFVAVRLLESRAAISRSLSGAADLPAAPSVTISTLRKERFPYAVAIAAGAITTVWLT